MRKILSEATCKLKCLAILAIAIVMIHCGSDDEDAAHERMNKEIYVDQFKLTYFKRLLIKSYNNSQAIQEVIAQDHSGFTEPVLTLKDLKLIDSLTTLDNFNLKADSTSSIGRVAEGAEGKHPLGYILNILDNNWLDSLARKRYEVSDANSFKP